jgi:hypothetical protein
MEKKVEITNIDLKYEGFRIKNPKAERNLLVSISEIGIREPLEGIDIEGRHILLNGFKRLRCAQKLGIGMVPYVSLGQDEVMGIIKLVRTSNSKSLNILEQAKLVNILKNKANMCISEISSMLLVSKGWVSMRIGILSGLSDVIAEKIFSGKFPVYSYMYTLRQFMRMNGVKKEEIEEFVLLVSGKNLSIRDIECLAYGYFKGPEDFREQLKAGNIAWALKKIKDVPQDSDLCNEAERGMLRNLEIVQKYIGLIVRRIDDKKFKNNSFYAQANLIASGILSKLTVFSKRLEVFYDRTGKTQSNLSSAQRRYESAGNKPRTQA